MSSIAINEKIPFNLDLKRDLVLFVIISFAYGIIHFEIFRIPFSEKNLKQELILIVILGLFFMVLSYINYYSSKYEPYDFYSKDFVEALSKGSFSLLEEPSEKLMSLNNPYDSFERNSSEIVRNKDYIWDAALYNGKYYVYFGILPVLILFLPHYLITGNFLTSATGVLIFSILSSIAMKALIEIIFKKYFQEIQFKYMVFSLLILLFGSQILILNGIPRFYEVPISAGMFFSILGIDFVLMAVYNEKTSYTKLFIGSLALALAVACRPTQLLASLTILPILIRVFINNVKIKKDIIKNILVIAIPYLTIGTLLMIYNYIRFGNILEFGAKYQLTINDMTHLSNRFATIGVGIICNLFSVPNFIPSFPFITNHNNLISFNGDYYIENMIGGLFILVPICFAICKFHVIYKKSPKRELVNFVGTLIIVGIIIAILSVVMGGSMQRYIVDYGWMFIIAGICIFLEIHELYKTSEAKNILKKIFSILTIYIVIVNLCGGIVSEKSYMKNFSPEKFYEIKYLIDFWE